jgi:transposase
LSGDQGDSRRKIRLDLRGRKIRYTSAHNSNKHRGSKFNKTLYRLRNRVERCFNRLKQFRRVATRYEKMGQNYLTILTLASIIIWL